MDQFTSKSQKFVQWLQERGVELSSRVELADCRAAGMGRGLVVRRDTVDADEQLLTVPASVFLHAGMRPDIEELARKHDLDDWSALIVTLMALQDTPEWKPYFDVLPTQFDTPMFWDPAEAAELLGPSGLVNCIGRDAADELYDSLTQTILQEPVFAKLPKENTSRESFHRFGSIIMAYSFDVPTTGDTKKVDGEGSEDDEDEDVDEDEDAITTKVLIPLADMINEDSASANVEFKLGDLTTSLVCRSTQPVTKAQQLFLPRTVLPSGERLRRFGYVAPDDQDMESVDISLELVKSCAAKKLDNAEIDDKLERLEDYMGEIPDTFEPSSAVVDGDKQLNYDDDLLVVVAALTSPEVKRKYLKNVVDLFTEEETMAPEAKELLESVLAARKNEYGDISKPTEYKTRKERAQFVLWAEHRVLEELIAGLKAIKTEGPPPKRAKTE